MMTLLLLLALAVPPMTPDDHDEGGPRCHAPPALPTVTEWTIVAGPGSFVVDARLSGYPNISQYYAPDPIDGPDWDFSISAYPVDEYRVWRDFDRHGAVVTDSTFHFVIPCPAGTWVYFARFNGDPDGEADTCSPYSMTDTLTITDPTAARRVSFGAVKARWR